MVLTRSGSVKSTGHDGEHISCAASGNTKGASAKKSRDGGGSPFKFLVTGDVECPCKICSRRIDKERGIMCDRCQAWVHMNCSDLETDEYNSLTKMRSQSVKWFCPPCTEELRNTPSADDRTAVQEAKIDSLMQIVTVLQQQNQVIQHR